MATSISHSPEETEALGQAWGQTAQPGWVIGLSGDLGAGKTRLVKGFARGLDIAERVHSPSFALVNIYGGGRLPLIHLDLYRLETRQQIISAGLEDYLQPAGVTVIEWADRWFNQPSAEPNSDELRNSVRAGPPAGVSSPQSGQHGTPIRIPQTARERLPARFRRVQIDVLSETERRITYEDFGA
jgi:tRNA threonylcarbamoyladenosine biosynthesis protein TsaE